MPSYKPVKTTVALTGTFLILVLVCQLILPMVGGQSLSSMIEGSKVEPSGSEFASPAVDLDLGDESEPNGTTATADTLSGVEGKIRGNITQADVDYFSFSATAGDKIYAGVITTASVSSSTANSVLEIRSAADAVLENDNNDGVFTANSSGIAGFVIPSTGTYYFRVNENAVGATNLIRPYYLFFAIRSGAFTAEAEPNNSSGTANPLPPDKRISGVVAAAADQDFFSVALGAGDTIFISLNLDPERDNVQFNGRLGLGNLGTANNIVQFADDASVGSATNPLSETFIFTAKNAGTYFIAVDDAAAGGAATSSYDLSATVIAAPVVGGCTTYTNSTPTPIADLTLSSSTITVPATTDRIRDLNLQVNGTHTFINDLDVHLRSPNGGGNDNGVFTDVGPATVGGPQTSMEWVFDDEAAIPPFLAQTGDITAIAAPLRHQPELNYRLNWFDGEDPSGTWTLDIRDDATGDVGTLTSWSLEICVAVPPAGTVIFDQNFESGAGGFTHSGTADEWELGTPNTTATTVSPPRAAFLNCNSGTNCWKTDLDDTYNVSSSQDLISPSINLSGAGGIATASWAMRYQIESATFDHAFVLAREVGNPSNSKVLWEWNGSTMTDVVGNPGVQIPASAGWAIFTSDVSSFVGTNMELVFHLDSDTTVQVSGMAIDDVKVYRIVAANVFVAGRVLGPTGLAIPNAGVTLNGPGGVSRVTGTNGFGWYFFENVPTGGPYTIGVSKKSFAFTPLVLTISGEVTNADIIGTPN